MPFVPWVCLLVCGLWQPCLIKSYLCILRTFFIFFFPLVKTVKQLGFYDESCFILPFTECSRLFFFSLCKLNSACAWFFGAFKERYHWPAGWKITMKCIKSCPQKWGQCVFLNAVVRACLCVCAHAFKHIHNVVCLVLLSPSEWFQQHKIEVK